MEETVAVEKEECCDRASKSAPSACPHLQALYALPAFASRAKLAQSYAASLSSSAHVSKKRRIDEKSHFAVPQCSECDVVGSHLFLLLDDAPVLLCQTHLSKRLELMRVGSRVAMDLSSGELFCGDCSDFVYADDPIQASADEAAHSKQVFVKEHMLGVRGLNNMGATCFINSVLQVLVHLPSVRAHFALDTHSLATCPRNKEGKICMMCELERVYIAMFSHKKDPFSPANLMYAIWKTKDDLAGYDQRDAQEFLVAILDELHNSTNASSPAVSSSCSCLVHRTFGGVMESWIKCTKCGSESTTWTPILEINIEVPKLLKNRLDESSELEPMTLRNSLANYCSRERLDDYKCAQCKCENLADRVFSISALPEVLTIHLKRFEQTLHGRKKIGTHIAFEDKIDLRPYISSTLHPSPKSLESMKNVETEYELIGIINHYGSLDRGHYKCCVLHRASSQWLLCDDHHITKVSREFVLRSDAYMLFYARKSSLDKSSF